MEDFLSTKSTTTAESYRARLNPFLAHLREKYGREAFRCRRKHVVAWYNQVLKPRQMASERATFCTIRSFFRYMYDQRLISSDPTRGLPVPKKVPRAIPRKLTAEQVKLLLDTSKQKKHRKVRPMLICSLFGSLRRCEIRMLKQSDVRKIVSGARPRYEIYVRNGKGNKQRVVRITGSVFRELEKSKKDNTSQYLFGNKKGNPFTLGTIHRRFKSLFTACGLENHSSHSFRHAFCTLSLTHGASLISVSKTMGHTSVRVSCRSSCARLAPPSLTDIVVRCTRSDHFGISSRR